MIGIIYHGTNNAEYLEEEELNKKKRDEWKYTEWDKYLKRSPRNLPYENESTIIPVEESELLGESIKTLPKQSSQEQETCINPIDDFEKEETELTFSTSIPFYRRSQLRQGEFLFQQVLPFIKTYTRLDAKAQIIVRIQYTKSILNDLKSISENCGEPIAAVYVDNLLNTLRTMRDLMTFDPYVEIIMAFHDALAFKNKWVEYTAEQYEKAYNLLKRLAQNKSISNEMIEKSIMKLEDIGFDTTPFGCVDE